MNIWSGSIPLDEKSQLRDLKLIDRSASWQPDISRDTTLVFRSFVNPTLIPLYARVGPSLELHTTDPETSIWLKQKLLGNLWLEDEDLDRFRAIQCPVGFLLGTNGTTRPHMSGWATTDLLVYGILSTVTPCERPPTPPESSSPEFDEVTSHVAKQQLRVYATPISAFLITKAQALPSPENQNAPIGKEQFAEFLPELHSPSPKRKRVATLFESVAQHHKRVRQKGGEGVSQLMAHTLSQSSSQTLQSLRIKRESEEPSLPILSKIASHRSRSLSISNLNPAKALENRVEHPRPSSNRSHARELVTKRNTPIPLADSSSRKERGASPSLLSSEGRLEPSECPKDPEAIIAENKNTITRTILTCMRLYGFNRPTQRATSSHKSLVNQSDPACAIYGEKEAHVATTEGVHLSTSTSHNEEDEFKAMYHATYRASTFALRKYLKEPSIAKDGSQALPTLLEKGKAMTYIDEFLRLFCEEEN